MYGSVYVGHPLHVRALMHLHVRVRMCTYSVRAVRVKVHRHESVRAFCVSVYATLVSQ